MRRQAEQAAVLVRIVAGLERRVKAMLEYAERHREAGLAEVEREAWRLSRDCFGEVVQAVIETRRQAGERQRQCECGGQLR
jgi:hypothetical protein